MELVVILVVVVAVGALIYFNRSARRLDINQDGRVDVADAVAAVENAAEGTKTSIKKAAVRAKGATRSAAKRPAAKTASAKKAKTPRK